MTDQSATALAATAGPATRLEPDAIGVAQDTVIGMASSAPAGTVGVALALLAAVNYGGGLILIITAIPMLIIANAYRRCNMWNANCGATFEWVGRSISPYLGFLAGWLMVAAYIIGTVAEVLLLGPSVLAVFQKNPTTSVWAYIGIGTAVGVLMLIISVLGIRLTARVQVGMALVEYLILVGLAIAGLFFVLGHHHGSYAITSDWFKFHGLGPAISGFLIAVFVYGGWDGTLYVNEEVKHRRVNPGRAAIIAVALLALIYTLSQIGFQGVVSPKALQANSASALVYVAQALGGGFWGKMMALAIALSVIATTGTGIVLSSRIAYGMASYRALPGFLGNVSRRFKTPAVASAVAGIILLIVFWVYELATSAQHAFNYVIGTTSLLFAIFYVLTALAMITYYRRRVVSSFGNFLFLGVLPLLAAGFLGWMFEQTVQRQAPWPERWALVGIIALGLVLMLIGRFGLRSPFFQIPRESEQLETVRSKHRA